MIAITYGADEHLEERIIEYNAQQLLLIVVLSEWTIIRQCDPPVNEKARIQRTVNLPVRCITKWESVYIPILFLSYKA